MRKTARPAFTMIELLVVIAVIGVMATAVLSAINPLEQINKGSDTGLRSDAEQLLSATDRYYSSLVYFPWQNGSSDPNVNIAWQNVVDLNTNKAFLTNLENTQEVKHGFSLRLLDSKRVPLQVYYDNSSASPTMYSGFNPKSNSFMKEAANRCKNTSATAGTPFRSGGEACGAAGVGSSGCEAVKDCYVCLP